MTREATVVSVRVGRVRELPRPDWDHHAERTWRTAYHKEDVGAPVRVERLGLEGDTVADTVSHGGPHMAVLAYSNDHYPAWREELGLPEMGPGGFGENLAIAGLDERSVCIGDVFAIGTVELEVASPRGPCAHISRRWNREDLLGRVVATHRTGWYLRVRREGVLQAGDTVRRIARPNEGWSVERVLRVRLARPPAAADLDFLAACPELSPEWRERFAHMRSHAAE